MNRNVFACDTSYQVNNYESLMAPRNSLRTNFLAVFPLRSFKGQFRTILIQVEERAGKNLELRVSTTIFIQSYKFQVQTWKQVNAEDSIRRFIQVIPDGFRFLHLWCYGEIMFRKF